MKRKIYALMLVVAMLAMTLVGCGGNATATTDTSNNSNEVKVEESTETVGGDEAVPEQPLEETGPNTFIKTETINLTPGYSEETKEYWAAQGKTLDGVDPEMTLWTVTSEMQMVDSATSNVITHQDEVTWEDTGEKTASIWVLTPDFYLIVNANAGDEDAADVTDYFYNATEELTVEGQKYIFEITKATCEGHYDFYVDSVVTVIFEGIYYEEGNKPNTSSQDTEPVPEPVEETVPEPVEEIVPEPEEVEAPKSYSGMLNFVYSTEAGNGITVMECKIFEYQDDKTQGTIEATINASGFDFVLSFDGDASLGTKAASRDDGSAGFIYNKNKSQWIQVYNCGRLSQETFNQYMDGDLKEYFDWANVDEYYEETKDDTYISAIVATTTMISDVEHKGYVRIILDLEKGVGVHLWYLTPVEKYDEQVAYDIISSAKIISEEESLTSLFNGN